MKRRQSWRADEMEMAINFKAVRLSWVFLTLSLGIWCLSVTIVTGEPPVIPSLLMCFSSCIFYWTKLWQTRQMTKPEAGSDAE